MRAKFERISTKKNFDQVINMSYTTKIDNFYNFNLNTKFPGKIYKKRKERLNNHKRESRKHEIWGKKVKLEI